MKGLGESSVMNFNALFDILDIERDGKITRKELHDAARHLGWHWHEAALFAVFDLLTLFGPLSRQMFNDYMDQISKDPLGPYGRVLLNAKYDSMTHRAGPVSAQESIRANIPRTAFENRLVRILEQAEGPDSADAYKKLVNTLKFYDINSKDTALLIIDPQRSFTKGAWMKSIGSKARQDVQAIESAFKHCAEILRYCQHQVETMFSRCPFPPDSYPWEDHFKGIIDDDQPYFVKPGNNILFPRTNGFRQWVEQVLAKGKRVLVMGGCTLNSCVRVSAIETAGYFKSKNLRVVVDLSISGARLSNYRRSGIFGGLSSVEAAVREMLASGVKVVRGVDYSG